jgi:two-component system sensor histidine kinase BaeS
VRDTGSGITADDLPHVFERFYRGDRSRTRAGGTSGLGLAIARALVEAHRGTISAESSTGTGSTFHITLPLA